MNQVQMLQEFNALPTEAQKLVTELVAFLGKEYRHSKPKRKKRMGALLDERFIGLWKDRQDMRDSNAYIRNLRKSDWR